MPRRDNLDDGDDMLMAPGRGDDHEKLVELERRLNDEVDEDLFEDPRHFHTLHRVIDVLGLQMIDDATVQSSHMELTRNPAYRQLKAQQQIVEQAIEHMAVLHCADLNGSVIQVGKVARQFSEAVLRVRQLRKQVRDIQDTLGGTTGANPNEAKASRPNQAAMSLRELWLKKLECEATLALLDRLDIIRAAPGRFDALLAKPPCRIGAAVLILSQALATMFSEDVAQVQALHKIMEQLLLRKQKAEDIVWETLSDVLYLRTGNGLNVPKEVSAPAPEELLLASSNQSVGSTDKSTSRKSVGNTSFSAPRSARNVQFTLAGSTNLKGLFNPFDGKFATPEDVDNDSVSTEGSGASLFSTEEDDENPISITATNTRPTTFRRMIPVAVLEAELDLEADERRCWEDMALSGNALSTQRGKSALFLPRYADPIQALRILVECLAHLRRLDDIERVLSESVERELRLIVQRQQARTFAHLEKKRAPTMRVMDTTLQEFRRHLVGLMSAFGCVMMRLTHLTEIVRLKLVSLHFAMLLQ
jgi:hypothetical protein